MTKTSILDLSMVPCGCANHALEELHKAISDPPGEGLWDRHQSPYIADHIEAVTARFASRLARVQGALMVSPVSALRKAMDDDDVHAYLSTKPTAEYSMEDWLLYVDLVFSRYLPDGVIRHEAEYLAVRSVLAGVLQSYEHKLAGGQIQTISGMLPETYKAALDLGLISGEVTHNVIRFAEARSAELMSGVSSALKSAIRKAVVSSEKAAAFGAPRVGLQSYFLDHFATANRDWRRVAVTECSLNANEGFIASLAPGTTIERVEYYSTACPFCRSIHGKRFVVSGPDDEKDGAANVWLGKTNEGRSSSPRKQSPIGLIERTPEELWWVTSGPVHPNCRGTWSVVPGAPHPDVDPNFSRWLDEKLRYVMS